MEDLKISPEASAASILNASYHHVPHDIVELILSQLPAKSLLRFKGVCKQWSATISDDPKFAEAHLQRSNVSCSSYLEFDHSSPIFSFRRIQLENNEFRELSTCVEHPQEQYIGSKLLGSCDGIFLFVRRGKERSNKVKDYLVSNPSTRTHRWVRCPHPIYGYDLVKSGICYDPLMKDYKVVIGDAKHYAVYYCNTKSWSELKEMNINVDKIDCYLFKGVHFKGSIYWISRFGLVCFDGRYEKFKNLGTLDCTLDKAYLISSRDCLYFFPNEYLFEEPAVAMQIVRDDDPWMKLELELPFRYRWVRPLCSMTRENQIILRGFDDRQGKLKYFLYDDTKSRRYATQIRSTAQYYHLFPNLENLLLL